jgi:hypothetical protein
VEELELSQKRLIKLELFRDDALIDYSFGYNNAFLSNVTLYPTNEKEDPKNYYIQCTFDLRDWPEAREVTWKKVSQQFSRVKKPKTYIG